jgi:hypothetical protein
MARVPAWPCTVDAGRCPRDRHSGGATGRFSGYRSGAAGRAQAGTGVVESAIYVSEGIGSVGRRNRSDAAGASLTAGSDTIGPSSGSASDGSASAA